MSRGPRVGHVRHRLDLHDVAGRRRGDELATTDEDIAEYVSALESAQDTSELPEASGDAIAKEFERYLRRRGDGTDNPA